MILVVLYLGLVIAVYVCTCLCVWDGDEGGRQCVHSEFVNVYAYIQVNLGKKLSVCATSKCYSYCHVTVKHLWVVFHAL